MVSSHFEALVNFSVLPSKVLSMKSCATPFATAAVMTGSVWVNVTLSVLVSLTCSACSPPAIIDTRGASRALSSLERGSGLSESGINEPIVAVGSASCL